MIVHAGNSASRILIDSFIPYETAGSMNQSNSGAFVGTAKKHRCRAYILWYSEVVYEG